MNLTTYTLAQTTQPGTPPAGQGRPRGGGEVFFFGLILMMVVFWIVMSRGQRKEQQKKKEMLAAIQKNDRVITVGGIMGVVVSVKGDEVVVKVDESSNTKITFARSFIQRVLTDEEEDR
jgi:preprotein translocase subunit YajC